jgi:hypothetical protein
MRNNRSSIILFEAEGVYDLKASHALLSFQLNDSDMFKIMTKGNKLDRTLEWNNFEICTKIW